MAIYLSDIYSCLLHWVIKALYNSVNNCQTRINSRSTSFYVGGRLEGHLPWYSGMVFRLASSLVQAQRNSKTWHLNITRDLTQMTGWGLPDRSVWWMRTQFSVPFALAPCPFVATAVRASDSRQRAFREQRQILSRRGAGVEVTIGFSMSSSYFPAAFTLNILTCYNNFLRADTHWCDTNGRSRLHQELPWRAVDSLNPTMRTEGVMSKGKLGANIYIDMPKMTHPAQQIWFLLMLYLIPIFGWETSNAFVMCYFYEQ